MLLCLIVDAPVLSELARMRAEESHDQHPSDYHRIVTRGPCQPTLGVALSVQDRPSDPDASMEKMAEKVTVSPHMLSHPWRGPLHITRTATLVAPVTAHQFDMLARLLDWKPRQCIFLTMDEELAEVARLAGLCAVLFDRDSERFDQAVSDAWTCHVAGSHPPCGAAVPVSA